LPTTIILPISREQHLLKVFASLEMLEYNRQRRSLLALVDGETDGAVFFLLYEAARQIGEVPAGALKQASGCGARTTEALRGRPASSCRESVPWIAGLDLLGR
jgi:hypothetical protein